MLQTFRDKEPFSRRLGWNPNDEMGMVQKSTAFLNAAIERLNLFQRTYRLTINDNEVCHA